MAIPWTRTATRPALRISPVCFAPGRGSTYRHPSGRSASSSTPIGPSIQPPSSGWPTARDFSWSGAWRSTRARVCGRSPRTSGTRLWPQSPPNTTTSGFSYLSGPRPARTRNNDGLRISGVRRDWLRRSIARRSITQSTLPHCLGALS